MAQNSDLTSAILDSPIKTWWLYKATPTKAWKSAGDTPWCVVEGENKISTSANSKWWRNFGWYLTKRMFFAGYGYGSIPINTIFTGMNIHLPAILMFTWGTRFWHTAKWHTPSFTVRRRKRRTDLPCTKIYPPIIGFKNSYLLSSPTQTCAIRGAGRTKKRHFYWLSTWSSIGDSPIYGPFDRDMVINQCCRFRDTVFSDKPIFELQIRE